MLEKLLKYVDKSRSHIYEYIPGVYSYEAGFMLHKLPLVPGALESQYRFSPGDNVEWEDRDWVIVHPDRIAEFLNDNKLDIRSFEAVLLHRALVDYLSAEHALEEIPALVGKEVIDRFKEDQKKYQQNIADAINKVVRKSRLRIVK